MLRSVFVNLKQILTGKVFWLCVCGVVLLEFLDSAPAMYQSFYEDADGMHFSSSVVNIFMLGGMTLYHLLVCTVCIFPYAGSYCDHKQSGYLVSILNRISLSGYAVSSMVTCALSAFLCMMAGEALFIGGLCLMMPVHVSDMEFYQGSWQSLENGWFGLFFLYRIVLRSLRAAFFAMISLVMSAYVRNKFFVMSVPMMTYFLTYYVISGLQLYAHLDFLGYLNVNILYFTFQLGLDKELQSLGLTAAFTLGIGILGTLIFGRKLRRDL